MAIRDKLITAGALYLILALAGASVRFAPDSMAMAAVSLLIHAALLAAYAFGTGPGRRTSFAAYCAATELGFTPSGGDPPPPVLLLAQLFNILVPIVAVIGLREFSDIGKQD